MARARRGPNSMPVTVKAKHGRPGHGMPRNSYALCCKRSAQAQAMYGGASCEPNAETIDLDQTMLSGRLLVPATHISPWALLDSHGCHSALYFS
jgi:hypothetical protein